ncbi:tetratricopeptide repeat protein, partial [bacterium]|nr:tetratricopeptide repeat protein [bacterium]
TLCSMQSFINSNGSPQEKLFLKMFVDFINGDTRKVEKEIPECLPFFKDPALRDDALKTLDECRKINSRENALEQEERKLKGEEAFNALRQKLIASKSSPRSVKPPDSSLRNPASESPVINSHFEAGLRLLRIGNTKEAKLFFQEIIRANPGDWQAFYTLAEILKEEGNLWEAIDCLNQALGIRPKDSKSLSLKALLLVDIGDLFNANEVALSALEADPNNAEGHLVIAKVYLRKNLLNDAQKEINAGLAIENASTSILREDFISLQTQLRESQTKSKK